MITLNYDIEELKQLILERGEESNWNYTSTLLLRNVLIKTQFNYEVVLFRYYSNSRSFFFTNNQKEYNDLTLIKAWASIEE